MHIHVPQVTLRKAGEKGRRREHVMVGFTGAAECQHWRPKCSSLTGAAACGRSDTGELSLPA